MSYLAVSLFSGISSKQKHKNFEMLLTKTFIFFGIVNAIAFAIGGPISIEDSSESDSLYESAENSREYFYSDRPAREPRINGGRLARPNEFPYQAAVMTRVRNTPVFVFVCGGAIYSKSYIVTAGHCLFNKDDVKSDPRDLRIVVGQRNVRLYIREESAELLQVNKTFVHNGFKSEGIYFVINDIGLIKLNLPLNYTASVKKLRVAGPSEIPAIGTGIVSGWGRTEIYLPDGRPIGGQAPLPVALELRTAQLRIVPRQICSIRHFTIVPETILCVASEGLLNSESACYGDSGGPLTCQGASGPFLCGLVSTGTGCGLRFTPSFYTDVSKFNGWIRGIAGNQ